MADNNPTLQERAKRFLASHGGDAEKAVSALLRDNLKYRERIRGGSDGAYKPDETLREENRNLNAEVERLQGMIPAAGAIVLTGDDATAWPKFKALNLAPDKISEALKETDSLRAKITERDKADVLTRAADAMGYKPSAFVKIAAAEGLHIEFKDVQVKDDDKTVTKSLPHVRKANDEKASLELLDTYAERELGDYMPALKTETEPTTKPAAGIPFPSQKPGGKESRPVQDKEKLVEAARATGEYQL